MHSRTLTDTYSGKVDYRGNKQCEQPEYSLSLSEAFQLGIQIE